MLQKSKNMLTFSYIKMTSHLFKGSFSYQWQLVYQNMVEQMETEISTHN